MTAITRTASPVQLTIDNYPSSKLDISGIKDTALDRLTIKQSTIDDDLINILDGLKYKQITVTECRMKKVAIDILVHSAKTTLFDRCRIVSSFRKPEIYEELNDFGTTRFEDEFVVFKPSLRDLAQKESQIFDQSLLQDNDAPVLQKKDEILKDCQKELREAFNKIEAQARERVIEYAYRILIATTQKLNIPRSRITLAETMAQKINAMAKAVFLISEQFKKARATHFEFYPLFIEDTRFISNQLAMLMGEYDVIRMQLVNIHLQGQRATHPPSG